MRNVILCWVIIDRFTGEWVMRFDSREQARAMVVGMPAFEFQIAKVISA